MALVQRTIRLGCVKYLNARPLVRGWRGQIEFGHPAVLCQRLADGELDAALVSSFEFLRNPIYTIVNDVAIASNGPVYSVFVASLPGSKPTKIELDPASLTAVALFRVLMEDRQMAEMEMPADKLSALPPNGARLLIGDQAIRFRQKFAEQYDYADLGAKWRDLMQLPFVYALWLIRPEIGSAEMIANELRARRDENLANLDQLISAESEFDHDFCARYYRDHLRFYFGDAEKQGLKQFRRRCIERNLLPDRELVIHCL